MFKQEILNELQNSEQDSQQMDRKTGHAHCKEII